MKKITALLLAAFLTCLLASCTSLDEKDRPASPSKPMPKGEYIYRKSDEYHFRTPPAEKNDLPPYSWDKGLSSSTPHISKEYFRCKGSSLNPMKSVQQNGETSRLFDCGGSEKHSLPLRDSKEFIYPILIDLLNYIQAKTGRRVVVTCGHRCPDHNTYADPAPSNQYSKHMIGAEVSFYVQGMESDPEEIVKIIQEYYKETPKYKGLKDFQEFKRWEKKDDSISTLPWYNKEVFIKLFKKKEGRDFDNRHPYPYLSVQVRYDRDKGEKVIYTWDKAFHNYMRW